MLRSGKTLSIGHSRIASNNGIILAPIINLHGLILRADKPIPPLIIDFLTSHGVIANRVRYKGDMFVRLKGSYELKAEDIQNFIQKNAAFIDEQNQGLDEVANAINSQLEIEHSIKFSNAQTHKIGPHYYIHGIIAAENTLDIDAKDSIEEGGISKARNIFAKTKQINIRGGAIEGYGFMAKYEAKKSVRFFGAANITNGAMEAGEELSLSPLDETAASTLSLSLEPNTHWVNTPCLQIK